jgi:heme A synthase
MLGGLVVLLAGIGLVNVAQGRPLRVIPGRIAGGLAAFSGFYFAVAMLTDSTYREEFLEELTDEMGSSFTAREEYLGLRAA